MPLPDERPRQSVANLIGRFEQQGKRQVVPTVPVVLRSSSVSSQIAGDAAKEEVKEKREWPPKTAASADIKPVAPILSSPPSSMSKSLAVSPQPIPDPPPPVDIPATPTPASPEPVKSPPSKSRAAATGKSTPTAGTRRSLAASAKSRSPIAHSSTRHSNGSPPKTSLPSPASHPIRPQHTGQSVKSNPPTARQARPVPRTAPSTPSRPKSSAAQNQPIARPKTPSSGLFAPTAASLARSRNAPPPPPPPVKKVTLSSDAAERLSKPTAASLSKARAPVPPSSGPARVSKPTSTGAHTSTPRGSSKPKLGRASIKSKPVDAVEEANHDLPLASTEPIHDVNLAADHVENGHESGITTYSDVGSPEDAHAHLQVSDVMHDPVSDEHVHSDPGVIHAQQGSEHPVEEDVHDIHEHDAQDLSVEEAACEHDRARVEIHEDSVPQSTESHVNGDSHKVGPTPFGNDIEDIVNLLEGTSISKPRPQSIVSIPDENPEEY